jgi:hypothetical protein
MTATPNPSPIAELPAVLPPIACTSWCEHGDGHPGLRHPEDQRCETEETRAYLHNRKHNDHADYVTTYVVRNGPQARPPIHLGVDIDPGVTLTPGEARRLGRSLAAAIDTLVMGAP